MNKRERLLQLIGGRNESGYVPAAFFLHFSPEYHKGRAAIERHLQFFRQTGMDFVKIQYEQGMAEFAINSPADWARARRFKEDDFEPTVEIVRGLVEAAGHEALVILTLYSPFMWARHLAGEKVLHEDLREHPEQAAKGLEVSTENVLTLVRACKRAGIDGFYASTQGGEAFRFAGSGIFEQLIKPTDLRVWDEIADCRFNILHVCDFEGPYDDFSPFVDYPGHVVNCPLDLGGRRLSPREAAELFRRPFMGGMERKGLLATGTPEEVRRQAREVLMQAPERFILAADCTVPAETAWDNLKAAIDEAHRG